MLLKIQVNARAPREQRERARGACVGWGGLEIGDGSMRETVVWGMTLGIWSS